MCNGASFKYKMKHWVLSGITFQKRKKRINQRKIKALVLQVIALFLT